MKPKKHKAPSLLSDRFDYDAQPIIWVDFEGRKKDKFPAMTTVLIGNKLTTYIHDPVLAPAAKAKGVVFMEWKELYVLLLQTAKEKGAYIAGYSIPERDYLYAANPDQKELVDKVYFNANAASWFRNKRPDIYERIRKTMPKMRKPGLKQFLLEPEVGYAYPKYLVRSEFSPAKALKQAREQLTQYHGKYSDISSGTKTALNHLIVYNQHDVLGMRHLVEFTQRIGDKWAR
jgi:hypothetical protein